MDTIETVKETVNRSLSGRQRYGYPEFFTTPVHFGNIAERQFRVKLPEIDENTVLVETPLRNIRDASQLKCMGENISYQYILQWRIQDLPMEGSGWGEAPRLNISYQFSSKTSKDKQSPPAF